jgi:hypothetical protein
MNSRFDESGSVVFIVLHPCQLQTGYTRPLPLDVSASADLAARSRGCLIRVSQTSNGSQEVACVGRNTLSSLATCSSDATVALPFMVSDQLMPYSSVISVGD